MLKAEACVSGNLKKDETEVPLSRGLNCYNVGGF